MVLLFPNATVPRVWFLMCRSVQQCIVVLAGAVLAALRREWPVHVVSSGHRLCAYELNSYTHDIMVISSGCVGVAAFATDQDATAAAGF
jgi:hypothetical protein